MTVEQEEAERASQRSAAVTDYNKQREVALSADLGAPGTDLIATWTALFECSLFFFLFLLFFF
jgi:hypothetical protein